ncbi:MAG: VanZ family protein [Bacteroidaceae bacterium]|nr:VanZ family protein [Bacteroidaceae bacterium]
MNIARNTILLLKRFPLTALCIVAIWVLCLFNPPQTPMDEVPLMDKWVHIAMYGGTMSIFWTEYWLSRKGGNTFSKLQKASIGVLAPILMSIVIELIQEYCTGGRRSGDWQDVVANSTGVFLALLLGQTVIKNTVRKYKLNKDEKKS